MIKRNIGSLDKYLDCTVAALMSPREAVWGDEMRKLGPTELMAGLDDDLAALCVSR